MNTANLSEGERLVLAAALNPDPEVASASWQAWLSQGAIEEARYEELRLLPVVHANLSRAAPQLRLPNKVRGKAKLTFAMNNLRTRAILPTIEILRRHAPVMPAKGLAFCIRFNAWTVRPMGDIDVYVPVELLDRVAGVLESAGWRPKHGLTWASLVYRTSLRRGSWNVVKDHLDLDLHWAMFGGVAEYRLNRNMWACAEPVDFLGQGLLLQSPEFAFASSLRHGFVEGTRADMMQSIVDAVSWLPICREEALTPVLSRAGLFSQFHALLSILQQTGRSEIAPQMTARFQAGAKRPRKARGMGARLGYERTVLSHPVLYRIWAMIGMRAQMERLLVKLAGPFSKPLDYSSAFQEEYDLTDCATIDRIAGPGFGWPEPEHTCFWSEGPDARLLLPLSGISDHVVFIQLADHRRFSPNAWIDVFANGHFAARINIHENNYIPGYGIVVPKRYLSAPWVELSFRPRPYKVRRRRLRSYHKMRSLPFCALRIYALEKNTSRLGLANISGMPPS